MSKFKVGEKVRVKKGFKCEGKQIWSSMKDLEGQVVTIERIEGKDFITIKESSYLWTENDFEKLERHTGIYLLERIINKEIKNCDIKVYKNDKYQFTIQCGEKAILDNPQHHIGMLTSDKYTYEPIIKKEMTIQEIEKELGYSIKIVKEK